MSYTALYRKFRPTGFEDVKGQNHIVTTLKNQMLADRIGHAYLFCGTRGTGKTSVAKIFAKAVNCENPQNGSPCGVCDSCKSIASGASLNVVELDAASNNGVDSIREIVESVEYRPTQGRYKVYIIDEVHMLSVGAFNALLKTLEEPPEYVIFILATTEMHKIPITIMSRCQQYSFKRISIETITDRLRYLVEQEQVEVEEKALRYIAKVADGSMRDALSLLDQCIAFYLGKKVTYDNVLEVLGVVDTAMFSQLLRAVITQDVNEVLTLVDVFIMQGRELTQLINDFTWYQRNLLLLKSSDNMEDVLDVSTENLAQLREEAEMIDETTLFRYIRIFSELSNQMRYATQKRIMLEVALIKLCIPSMEADQESVVERVRTLENKMEHGMVVQAISARNFGDTNDAGGSSVAKKLELPTALPEEIQEVAKNFRSIANTTTGLMRTYLKQANISLGENGKLLIVTTEQLHANHMNREDSRQELEGLIAEKVGKVIEVEIRLLESNRQFEEVYVDLEKTFAGLEVEVEDE